MKIHTIVACCENLGIGIEGKLPWRLKKEMQYFSKITTGFPQEGRKNVVVMGRNTWDSIPTKFRPLKNRWNIVISRTIKEPKDGMHAVVSSLTELETLLNTDKWKLKINTIFNIGGAQIYKLVHDSVYADLIFMTRIQKEFICDTFFSLNKDEFTQLSSCPPEYSNFVPEGASEEDDITWKVEIYQKN